IYAGDARLQTPNIDNSGGQLSVSELAVSGPRFSNAGGTLNVAKGFTAQVGQFDNAGGHLRAGSIDIDATGDVHNGDGQLRSDSDIRIVAQGVVQSSGSVTAARHVDVVAGAVQADDNSTLGAGVHADGSIGREGDLRVQASGELAAHGIVAAAGDLHAQADSVDLSGSRTSASNITLTAAQGDLNTRRASVVAAEGLQIQAQGAGATWRNDGGTAQAQQLTVNVPGISNTGGGVISQLGSAPLILAPRDANAVAGGIDNSGGSIVSHGDLRIDAAFLANRGGTLSSTEGSIEVGTGGLNNEAGLVQSKGRLTIDTQGQQLNNAGGGQIQSKTDVVIASGALDNAKGFIAADGALTISSGEVNNDEGLLRSKGGLAIDTHGQRLSNRNTAAAEGGISSGQTVVLAVGQLDNRGGQTLSDGDLQLTATRIDNSAGLIHALGRVDLRAKEIDNTATLDADSPQAALAAAATDGAAPAHGIQGQQVAIAADALNNANGAIRGGQDITVVSGGRIDNSGGLMASNNALSIQDPASTSGASARTLEVVDTGGMLIANERVAIDAKQAGLDGTLASGRDLSIALQDDIDNIGEISAIRNLSLSTRGNIRNSGKIVAGESVSVRAQDIDNAATGEISAASTHVEAQGTLTNRGLIDGATTRVDAATVDNVGSGRIYGNELSIQAKTLNNLAETIDGKTQSATIAARSRLDIGAKEINNRDNSLIASDGDLFIGGQLDDQYHAAGVATVLNNRGSRIESTGNMGIAVASLNNISEGISWEVKPGEPKHVVQYSVAGDPKRYDASEVVFISYRGRVFDTSDPRSPGDLDLTYLVVPAPEYPLERFRQYYWNPPAYSSDTSEVRYSGGENDTSQTVNTPGAWYAADNPIWVTFGVTPPAALALDNPLRLYPDAKVGDDHVVGYTDTPSGQPAQYQIPLGHAVTQAEYDAWVAYTQAHAKLDVEILKFYDSYQGRLGSGIPSRSYKEWDAYDLTATTPSAQAKVAAPASIVAGGDLNILGAGRNVQGQILAGRTLHVEGGPIVNEPETLKLVEQVDGLAIHSYEKSHVFKGTDRKYDATNYSSSTPVTIDLAAGKIEGGQSVPPVGTGGAGPRRGGLPAITEVPSEQDGRSLGLGVPNAALGGAIGSVGNSGTFSARPLPQDLVVRTSTPNVGLPTASLFSTRQSGTYLVETDPRFAGYRQWLSSDYLLNNLGLDPLTTQKRIGDGYYEQRLVREQVAYLTGYRFLDGFASDEDQYQALMNAGSTFAQKYNLRPGVALSAEQMA
ncbi:MAG: hypothetical protein JSS56_24405, partial [Proteobacteria bacterium]|nr:hypothetical protein [Pseudomonadota bacterium]